MRLSELNHPQLFLVRGRGEQVDRGIAGGVLDVALVHLHLNIRVAPDIRFRLPDIRPEKLYMVYPFFKT